MAGDGEKWGKTVSEDNNGVAVMRWSSPFTEEMEEHDATETPARCNLMMFSLRKKISRQ